MTSALETLQSGEPRPTNPKVDDTFSLLKQLLGNVPQNLEEKQIYSEKLAEAHRALQLATKTCQQKQLQLKALKDEARSHEASQLHQQLLGKAQEFNAAIDRGFDLLEEMKKLNSQITQLRRDRISVLELRSDTTEIPYFQIGSDRLVLRRRFDILRE